MSVRSLGLLVLVACNLEAPREVRSEARSEAPAVVTKGVPARAMEAVKVEAPSTTWLARWAGRDFEEARSVAIAADGSTVVTGDAGAAGLVTTTFAPVDERALPAAGTERTSFVAKFGPHGEPLFVVGLPALHISLAAAPTGDGGTITVGMSHPPRVDGSEKGPVQADTDGFVARHDPLGRVMWLRRLAGAGIQAVHHVAALPGGGYVIAGRIHGEARLGGDPAVFGAMVRGPKAEAGPDTFVARIDDDGTVGWVGAVDGDGENLVDGLAVGSDGTIALTGECRGDTAVRGAKGEARFDCDAWTLASWVAVWSDDGAVRWGRRIPSPNKDEQTPEGVAVLSDGAVVVTGFFKRGIGGGGLAELTNDRPAYVDGYVARFAGADGAPRWIRHLRGTSGEAGWAAAPARDGAVWVVADFSDGLEIGDGTTYVATTLRGDDNAALLRFDAAGVQTHLELIGGKAVAGSALARVDAGEVRPGHMAVGTGGELRIVGSFGGMFRVQGDRGQLDITAMASLDGFVLARPAPP